MSKSLLVCCTDLIRLQFIDAIIERFTCSLVWPGHSLHESYKVWAGFLAKAVNREVGESGAWVGLDSRQSRLN